MVRPAAPARRETERQQGFQARHARRGLREGHAFGVRAKGVMIAADGIDRALVDRCTQAVTIGGAAQRRIHPARGIERGDIGVAEV